MVKLNEVLYIFSPTWLFHKHIHFGTVGRPKSNIWKRGTLNNTLNGVHEFVKNDQMTEIWSFVQVDEKFLEKN